MVDTYDELLQKWHQRGPGPVYDSVIITEEGLFLGAETCLARFRTDNSPEAEINEQQERVLALLSVAYWQPVPVRVLDSVRRAACAYRRGEKVLPYIYLAHGGLRKFENAGEAACRVFVADRLLAEGVSPLDLLKGLDIDAGPIRLLKASPDDPKHPGWPAGAPDGRGGQFRPKDNDAPVPSLPMAIPVADFSGGFHGAVVDTWMDFFQQKGIPAVREPAIRFIGPNSSVFGFPDMIANVPGMGLVVIEVKTGDNPVLTPNQMAYLPMLQLGAHMYSTDPSITKLGLVPGVPFPPLPVVILYAPGPGQPYDSWRLPPPQFEK